MRRLVLKMSMSVDGFIAGPNGEIDWMIRSRDEGAKAWVAETLWPDLCSLDVLAQSRSQLKKVLGQEWRRLEIGSQNLLFRVDEADVDLVDFARGLGRVERGESGAIKQ